MKRLKVYVRAVLVLLIAGVVGVGIWPLSQPWFKSEFHQDLVKWGDSNFYVAEGLGCDYFGDVFQDAVEKGEPELCLDPGFIYAYAGGYDWDDPFFMMALKFERDHPEWDILHIEREPFDIRAEPDDELHSEDFLIVVFNVEGLKRLEITEYIQEWGANQNDYVILLWAEYSAQKGYWVMRYYMEYWVSDGVWYEAFLSTPLKSIFAKWVGNPYAD